MINLLQVESISSKPTSKLKIMIESRTHQWAYSILCNSEAERNAWLQHLSVWINVRSIEDYIPIPEILAKGILSCIEFCMFYVEDVEGLLRVPGNSIVVLHEIYYGICRFGEKFLTQPTMHLVDYLPNSIISGSSRNDYSISDSSAAESSPPTGSNSGTDTEAQSFKDAWPLNLTAMSSLLSMNKSFRKTGLRPGTGRDKIPVFDVFDVGSCIKLAFSRLPETLLTNKLFDKFMDSKGKTFTYV